VLPFGAPEFGEERGENAHAGPRPRGGYVLAFCHNIQREVPAENVLAMFDAAAEYGEYSINGGGKWPRVITILHPPGTGRRPVERN
jgi:hypothetical protein